MYKQEAVARILALVMLVWGARVMGAENDNNALAHKQEALRELRLRYAETGIRGWQLREMPPPKSLAIKLNDNGTFKEEWGIEDPTPFLHLWRLADSLRAKPDADIKRKVYLGILHYGQREIDRDNNWRRFHGSCFAIPRAAVNIYFAFYEDMERAERGEANNKLLVDANAMLRTLAMQSWTQPYRNDATDKNVVQVDRFRNHVWWVGGNALAYRPVFATAILMDSVPMVDVISTVAKKSLGVVSQTTYDQAFWNEGMTADGAGWGHGKQCLVWGYPLDGISHALDILRELQQTPWAKKIDRDNVEATLNYIRGSSWYFYKGFVPPCFDRANMNYHGFKPEAIRSRRIAETLLSNFAESLTQAEREELKFFLEISAEPGNSLILNQEPAGRYAGTRYFYNNDDLIAKNSQAYMVVNMASSRCHGLESAKTMASGYNFYTADGQTLFQRTGDEYLRAIGAWNLTAVPGVTARQGEHRLHPTENWRGFNSRHNYAAGATRDGGMACAGFVFEKQGASENHVLFGVAATKGYFLFDDLILCLGAGITNKKVELDGDVWTTIDQTLWKDSVYIAGSETKMLGAPGGGRQVTPLTLTENGKAGEPEWVVQRGGFAYGVLSEQTTGTAYVSVEERETKWDKLSPENRQRKDKTSKENILQVWVDHGRAIKNGRYGYLVWMGMGAPPANMPLRVLANSPGLQAVTNDRGVTQAMVYDCNSVIDTGEWLMMASSPCAILVERSEMGVLVTVCDALMNRDLNIMTIKTTLPLAGSNTKQDGQWTILSIALPTEPYRGKPVTVEYNEKY